MDLDPTLRGGVELGLKIGPMKTSSLNHHNFVGYLFETAFHQVFLSF